MQGIGTLHSAEVEFGPETDTLARVAVRAPVVAPHFARPDRERAYGTVAALAHLLSVEHGRSPVRTCRPTPPVLE